MGQLCYQLNNEYVLKGNITKGVQHFIRQSTRTSWGSSKHAAMQDLARHWSSLTSLKNGSRVRE